MNVSKLIEVLKKLPQDLNVITSYDSLVIKSALDMENIWIYDGDLYLCSAMGKDEIKFCFDYQIDNPEDAVCVEDLV